jgi:hypothetical protein
MMLGWESVTERLGRWLLTVCGFGGVSLSFHASELPERFCLDALTRQVAQRYASPIP